VTLLDLSQAILDQARNEIRRSVRLHRLLVAGGEAVSPGQTVSRITFATDYQLLSNVDFVIENVTEKWGAKSQVYTQLDAICLQRCVFAANTSVIPIAQIASLTDRPSRVLGMHFMNPVALKPVVEVIRGPDTSDETLWTAEKLLAQMGKECIIVGDSPGFVSNRVLMLTVNEAMHVVQEKLAPAQDVDRLFRTCFGHKMGPLETADLIGLDTVLHSLQILHESFGGDKYRPCQLLEEMVDAGLHGRKSGRGFYTYQVPMLRRTEQEG
jgi:3-hydroxybutyryl-CoA dehydrogenase